MMCIRQILCQEREERSNDADNASTSIISEKRKSSDCETVAPQTSSESSKDDRIKSETKSEKCEGDALAALDIKKEEKVESSSSKVGDSTEKKKTEPVSSTASGDEEKLDSKNGGSKNNNNNAFMADLNQPSDIRAQAVFTNPGLEYWRKKNPLADKIFITDVTVDLNTVTIRECATEKGFFRERPNGIENEG